MKTLYKYLKEKGKTEHETNLIVAACEWDLALPEEEEKLVDEWRRTLEKEIREEWKDHTYIDRL